MKRYHELVYYKASWPIIPTDYYHYLEGLVIVVILWRWCGTDKRLKLREIQWTYGWKFLNSINSHTDFSFLKLLIRKNNAFMVFCAFYLFLFFFLLFHFLHFIYKVIIVVTICNKYRFIQKLTANCHPPVNFFQHNYVVMSQSRDRWTVSLGPFHRSGIVEVTIEEKEISGLGSMEELS